MKRLAIGFALTTALVACSGSGGTPAAAVEEFMKKVEAGECDGLRDYISASGRELAGPSIEQVCGVAKEQRAKNPEKAKQEGLKQIHVVESKEEGDKATLKFEPERNDGQRESAGTFVMVKEDGRWRIDLLGTAQAMGAGGPGGLGGMGPGAPAPTPGPAQPAPPPAPAPAPAK
jgi:hypothetical protein